VTQQLSGIQACVFDAYGTLFDFNAAAARSRDLLGDQANALSKLWREKQLQYSWLRSLMGRHCDFWQLTGEALDFALRALSIEDAKVRERLMGLYKSSELYPDVRPLLDRLRAARLETAILSNGSPEMLSSGVEGTGIRHRLKMPESTSLTRPHTAWL
jgi:2-haloacid dehalogenase